MSTRCPTPVPNNDARAGLFKQENLFSIVMLVKRDRLFGLQGLGEDEEIFGPAELFIDLDRKRNASERAGAVH